MSAKEMFEKLGFTFKEKIKNLEGVVMPKKIEHTISYHNSNGIYDENSWLTIKFDLLKKEIFIYQDTMSGLKSSTIKLNVLQAINKQVEELGWNNER